MSPHAAEETAYRTSGAPEARAALSGPLSSALRLLLALGALATGGIALWLFMVVSVVLPVRDPAHVGMWTGLALGFLCYAGLSLALVLSGERPAWLPWMVGVLSLGAVGFGGYAIAGMLRAADAGGHFEGYLLLMGAVLAGHGLCALAYVALTEWIARRMRAA